MKQLGQVGREEVGGDDERDEGIEKVPKDMCEALGDDMESIDRHWYKAIWKNLSGKFSKSLQRSKKSLTKAKNLFWSL
jgi:hypothetical protein